MGKWKKSSAGLVSLFEELTSELKGIEPRQMFGYPCCFINGNLFTGLHQENWIVRLEEKDRETLKDAGGANFEPMKGRVMKEYIAFPQEILDNPEQLREWLHKSFDFAKGLPKKVKKKK